MCGKEDRLFKTEVEGTQLNVCKDCSKYGKIISSVRIEVEEEKKTEKVSKKVKEPEKDMAFVIVEDYADRIKKRREKLGIKQEDFAKKISEKESLVHKIETGHFEPSISLAMKIERFLKIKLIEQYEENHLKKAEKESDGFTIGDILKTK